MVNLLEMLGRGLGPEDMMSKPSSKSQPLPQASETSNLLELFRPGLRPKDVKFEIPALPPEYFVFHGPGSHYRLTSGEQIRLQSYQDETQPEIVLCVGEKPNLLTLIISTPNAYAKINWGKLDVYELNEIKTTGDDGNTTVKQEYIKVHKLSHTLAPHHTEKKAGLVSTIWPIAFSPDLHSLFINGQLVARYVNTL